jgi:hypothetical protein
VFKTFMRLLFSRRGDEFAESAIALPVVLLVSFALLNLTLAGFANVNANNAANYGARVGSVTQKGAASAAYKAAMQSVGQTRIGKYTVKVTGGGFPGAQIKVSVNWQVPSIIDGLMKFVGGGSIGAIKGSAVSAFRQEGW